MLFSSMVRVRVRISIGVCWLVGGYAHVFVLLSAVIVILPYVTATETVNIKSMPWTSTMRRAFTKLPVSVSYRYRAHISQVSGRT